MKKGLKIGIGGLFIICILLGLGYLGLAVYYENGFSFLTYINGIYCTGKSIETVNMELNDAYEYEGLQVEALEGSFYITADRIAYCYDYREVLEHYLQKQNPYLWIENLLDGQKEYSLLPTANFSPKALQTEVEEQLAKWKLPKEHRVSIAANEDGFVCLDTKVDILDEKLAFKTIKEALEQGKTSVNLYEQGCYYDEAYTEAEQELLHFYPLLERYQSKRMVYSFGEETEEITKGSLAKTLACFQDFQQPCTELPKEYAALYLTKEGTLLVDEEAAKSVLEECLRPYNTYQNHSFVTHDGRTLSITGGTYGNQINMKAEQKEFLAFLKSEESSCFREPEYKKEAAFKGKNDIGDTYIEVDIGQQKMFYYRDGALYLETDVVTGKNKATPEGVCYVYAKQKNRVLRGPGYASPVKYWMPVNGGIGIHDASWRKEYGGEIYLKNGSHGCINTPLAIVEKMYEVMEIGTPCILYYGLNEDE